MISYYQVPEPRILYNIIVDKVFVVSQNTMQPQEKKTMQQRGNGFLTTMAAI